MASPYPLAISVAAAASLIFVTPTRALAQNNLTVVNAGARTGIDTDLFFAGPPITINVTVHVHPNPSVGIDLTATVVVTSGGHTRRSIAASITDQFKTQLIAAGFDPNLVKQGGSSVYVSNTPPKGPNTGTLTSPIISPDPPNQNKPHTQTHTE